MAENRGETRFQWASVGESETAEVPRHVGGKGAHQNFGTSSNRGKAAESHPDHDDAGDHSFDPPTATVFHQNHDRHDDQHD